MDHFTALKNEQTARIVMRETALYVYIGTIFAVYAAEGQAGANAALVEWIQAVSTALSAIMFSIYLSNDFYVSRIGAFVRGHPQAGAFIDWENFHRQGIVHAVQKSFRTIVVILLFGGWALYRSIPVLETGQPLTKAIAIVFGTIILIELLAFCAILFGVKASATGKPKSTPAQ